MTSTMADNKAVELYINFRAQLPLAQRLALAPYPKPFANHKNRSIFAMLFYEVAQDALREIPNAINDLQRYIWHLDAWRAIYNQQSDDDRHELLLEHIRPLAIYCLNAPYALQGRIIYASALASFHASKFQKGSNARVKWPKRIDIKKAKNLAEAWAGWGALECALNALNSEEFATATNNYRKSYHHGHPPQIELGYIRKISPVQDSEDSWSFGDIEPLLLDKLIPLLVLEHARALVAFEAFMALVAEQAESAPAPDL